MSDGTGHFSDLFCDVKWSRVEIQAEFRKKIAHPVRRQQLWQAPIWGTHTSLDVRISQIQFPSDFNPRAIHISKADMLDGFVAWIIYKRQRSHLSYVQLHGVRRREKENFIIDPVFISSTSVLDSFLWSHGHTLHPFSLVLYQEIERTEPTSVGPHCLWLPVGSGPWEASCCCCC